jgi:hypothetical protein
MIDIESSLSGHAYFWSRNEPARQAVAYRVARSREPGETIQIDDLSQRSYWRYTVLKPVVSFAAIGTSEVRRTR